MIRVNQITMRPGHSKAALRKKAARVLGVAEKEIGEMKIVRRSVDARKKPDIFYSYTLDVAVEREDSVLGRFLKKGQGNFREQGGSREKGSSREQGSSREKGSPRERRKSPANQVCRVEETVYRFPEPGQDAPKPRVVIVGMGPAGLFCGYFLALHGYRPILLERGKCVEERQRDVELFWETGRLNPASNVQFGEGGAGAFSDGKLNTLVKDKDGRNGVVLETLVRFGAPESILYEAKPHIGTDVLCGVVRRMREEIIRLGGEVRFENRVAEICIEQGSVTGVWVEQGTASGICAGGGTASESVCAGSGAVQDDSCAGKKRAVSADNREYQYLACGQLVLAVGHSARDTFAMLEEKQVPMEAKAFAVGLRVEHPQAMVNESQYGMAQPKELGAAPYKVTAKAGNGRGVYSFCMCPGGYVVNASSEAGHTAVNGMSYSGRDGRNANSAVVVTVTPQDYGSDHPLAGIEFQRMLEERAYAAGGGRIPVQRYGAFKECVERNAGRFGEEKQPAGKDDSGCRETGAVPGTVREPGEVCGENADPEVMPQCRGLYTWADVSRILPKSCNEAIVDGMEAFGRQIAGFNRPDACLSGVESRTSSPVRILRDETMQSEVKGLYPCGEGAGYAGGILSAAMDGLRTAEAVVRNSCPQRNDG